mmetsp:Transcript_16044/g.38296  ORF Transcript_16044/g.38296 Transcript_16044/m.38296 type:complete len:316 (+) Transcript_16044:711-1658(+)
MADAERISSWGEWNRPRKASNAPLCLLKSTSRPVSPRASTASSISRTLTMLLAPPTSLPEADVSCLSQPLMASVCVLAGDLTTNCARHLARVERICRAVCEEVVAWQEGDTSDSSVKTCLCGKCCGWSTTWPKKSNIDTNVWPWRMGDRQSVRTEAMQVLATTGAVAGTVASVVVMSCMHRSAMCRSVSLTYGVQSSRSRLRMLASTLGPYLRTRATSTSRQICLKERLWLLRSDDRWAMAGTRAGSRLMDRGDAHTVLRLARAVLRVTSFLSRSTNGMSAASMDLANAGTSPTTASMWPKQYNAHSFTSWSMSA